MIAFQYCEQAAKEKGQDQTADLNCMKWSLTVKKDCWPCVCEVAKKQHYNIKGCDTIMEIIAVAKQLRDLTNWFHSTYHLPLILQFKEAFI